MIALDTPQPRPLQTALRLAKHGIPAFPCRADTKRPYTEHGFKDATTDATLIRAWWKRWPMALVAIPTGKASGRVILDLDNKTGEHEGQRSLERLETEHGELPDTPQAITRTQGSHYYFAAPPGVEVPCSAGKLGEGIDVRGDGGYVIVPGSVGYEWDAAHHPADVPLAQIPDWLLGKMLQGNSTKAARTDAPATVPPGGRNAYLTSVGGGVRRAGCDEEEIYAVLEIRNRNVCTPPLPDSEVKEIARSLVRYEPSEVPRVPALTRTERDLRAMQRLQSSMHRALAHPRARKLVPVATRLASELVRQKQEGEAPTTDDGLRHISKAALGGRKFGTDDWDIKESTLKNHLEEIRGYEAHIPGFRAEIRPVNYPRKEVDPETGEITLVDDYRDTWLYDYEGDAADLLSVLPHLPYPEDMRGKCSRCGHDKKTKTVEFCPNCEVVEVRPKEGVGHTLTPTDIRSVTKPMGASACPTPTPTLGDWDSPSRYAGGVGQTLTHPPQDADAERWEGLYERAEASTPRVSRPTLEGDTAFAADTVEPPKQPSTPLTGFTRVILRTVAAADRRGAPATMPDLVRAMKADSATIGNSLKWLMSRGLAVHTGGGYRLTDAGRAVLAGVTAVNKQRNGEV